MRVDTLLSESLQRNGYQFFKFCLVGILNTAVDLGIYYILTRHAGFVGDLVFVAKGISAIIAIFNSFIFNRLWTFGKTDAFEWRELTKFYLTTGSGIFINIGIHFINISLLGINDLASSAIAAGFTAIWGFTLAKFVVFK